MKAKPKARDKNVTSMRLGIVGSTGLVGKAMHEILYERGFAAIRMRFFASSHGKRHFRMILYFLVRYDGIPYQEGQGFAVKNSISAMPRGCERSLEALRLGRDLIAGG